MYKMVQGGTHKHMEPVTAEKFRSAVSANLNWRITNAYVSCEVSLICQRAAFTLRYVVSVLFHRSLQLTNDFTYLFLTYLFTYFLFTYLRNASVVPCRVHSIGGDSLFDMGQHVFTLHSLPLHFLPFPPPPSPLSPRRSRPP